MTAAIRASDVTADLFRRLRLRQNGNGVILLCEVGDGAGFGNRGWTDAISMQTWPSKKLIIAGYEVKATRQDWLRELDKPEKNETWQQQCHEWYVVAPKDVVKLEELPTGWGLMVPSGDHGLRIACRSDTTKADTVPLDLMAAVFRAAGKERERSMGDARNEIRGEEQLRLAAKIAESNREAGEWEKKYVELAVALGSRWSNFDLLKKRAEAVRELESGHGDPILQLRVLREKYQRLADGLVKVEREIEDYGCEGEGRCHGPLKWCDNCGDVSKICDMSDCDVHRDGVVRA